MFLNDARVEAETSYNSNIDVEKLAQQRREEYLNQLVDFLRKALDFDVTKRITAAKALEHPYLAPIAAHHAPLAANGLPAYTSTSTDGDVADEVGVERERYHTPTNAVTPTHADVHAGNGANGRRGSGQGRHSGRA